MTPKWCRVRKEEAFSAKKSYGKPYACKQTTAFAVLAHLICGRATKVGSKQLFPTTRNKNDRYKNLSFLFGVGKRIRTSAPRTGPTSLAGTPLTADLSIPTSVTDLRLQTTVFASLLYNYTQFFCLCQ